jgi:hypothetical protein
MEQRAFDDPVMDSGTQAPEGRSDAISLIVREGQPAEAPPMSAEETWLPRPRSGDPRDLRQACRECCSAYVRTQVTQESTDALLGSLRPERDTYSRNQAPVVNATVMDDAGIPRDGVYIPMFQLVFGRTTDGAHGWSGSIGQQVISKPDTPSGMMRHVILGQDFLKATRININVHAGGYTVGEKPRVCAACDHNTWAS